MNATSSAYARARTYAEARHVAVLLWHYGLDHTNRILSGRDPRTEEDVAKWARLGR